MGNVGFYFNPIDELRCALTAKFIERRRDVMEKIPSPKAVESIARLTKGKIKGDSATLARFTRSAVAEDGRVLHRFVLFDRTDPNGARHVAIVDDHGMEVAADTLSHSVKASLGEAVVGRPVARAIAPPGAGASIDPTSNNLVLEMGDTEEEVVTVTIPPNAGVSKADVYLLADTTGSMTSILAAVKAGADAIQSASYGPIDIAFGVGNYRDLPEDKPPFKHQLNPDTNTAAVTAAISTWSAKVSSLPLTRSRRPPAVRSDGATIPNASSCGSGTRPAMIRSARPCPVCPMTSPRDPSRPSLRCRMTS
jgi:hypothetical protein